MALVAKGVNNEMKFHCCCCSVHDDVSTANNDANSTIWPSARNLCLSFMFIGHTPIFNLTHGHHAPSTYVYRMDGMTFSHSIVPLSLLFVSLSLWTHVLCRTKVYLKKKIHTLFWLHHAHHSLHSITRFGSHFSFYFVPVMAWAGLSRLPRSSHCEPWTIDNSVWTQLL